MATGRGDLTERIVVDGRPDLLFCVGAPYARDDRTVRDSNLDGPRSRPVRIVQRGGIDIVGVRFQPGGLASFTRLPQHELRDALVEPHALFGAAADRLEAALSEDGDPDRRAALLDAFLLRHRRSVPRPYVRLATLVANAPSVARAATVAGLSLRTLERAFAEGVGLPPRFYRRVARFDRFVRGVLVDPGRGLGDVALAVGYHDQSHLVRDVTALAGCSPSELTRELAHPSPQRGGFVQGGAATGD